MGILSRLKWCLLGCLTGALVLVVISVFFPGELTNAVKLVANNNLAYKVRAFTEQEAVKEATLIEMVVETVGVSRIDYTPVVILKEKAGERYLPIWIGPAEANAISVILEGVSVERPLTPDLLRSVIDRLGASVDSIVINDIRDNTFYAGLILDVSWMQVEVDSRPSDAIAIAVRVRAPIYVEEAVLNEAGIQLDQETGNTIVYIEEDRPGVALREFHLPGEVWFVVVGEESYN